MPKKEKEKAAAEQQQQQTNAAQQPEEAQEPEAKKPQADPREEEMIKLSEKLADASDKYLRLFAEFDNYRKRTQREREQIYPDAVADTVKEFLPILDNFERAIEQPCSDEAFDKGVTMIYRSFIDKLGSMGVAQIGEVGEAFDPAIHNAVMHVDDDKLGKNVVSMVMQKGYRIGDKVLRYAMVQQAN